MARQQIIRNLETLRQALVLVNDADARRAEFAKVRPRKKPHGLIPKWSLTKTPPSFAWITTSIIMILVVGACGDAGFGPLATVAAVAAVIPANWALITFVLRPLVNPLIKWSNRSKAATNAAQARLDANFQQKYRQLAQFYWSIGGSDFYPQAYLNPTVVGFVRGQIERHLASSIPEALRQWEDHLRHDRAARQVHAQTQLLRAIDLELAWQGWTHRR